MKKTKRKLIHITAKHKLLGTVVDLYYTSVALAKKHNSGFEQFREIGYRRKKQRRLI